MIELSERERENEINFNHRNTMALCVCVSKYWDIYKINALTLFGLTTNANQHLAFWALSLSVSSYSLGFPFTCVCECVCVFLRACMCKIEWMYVCVCCRSVMSNNQFQLHRIEMDVQSGYDSNANKINEINKQKRQQQHLLTHTYTYICTLYSNICL